MIDAIGLPKNRLCHYCWTGEYHKPGEAHGENVAGAEEPREELLVPE